MNTIGDDVKRIAVAIIAIACSLVLAGCAKPNPTPEELIGGPIQEMLNAIEKDISEPGRQEQLLAIVDELDGVLKDHATDLEAVSRDLSRLNVDYDVPREAFDGVVSGFALRAKARRQRILDLHFQMTGLTSPEEWKPISKHEVEALGAAGSYLTN